MNRVTFHSGANLRPGEIEEVEKREERRWIIAQVKTDLRDVGKPRRNRREGASANGGSHAFLIGGVMVAFAWGADLDTNGRTRIIWLVHHTDDLAPALFLVLGIALGLLLLGAIAISVWRRLATPSTASICAAWAAIIWSFLSVFNLAMTPQRDLGDTFQTTVLYGLLITCLTWIAVWLFSRRFK